MVKEDGKVGHIPSVIINMNKMVVDRKSLLFSYSK